MSKKPSSSEDVAMAESSLEATEAMKVVKFLLRLCVGFWCWCLIFLARWKEWCEAKTKAIEETYSGKSALGVQREV